MQPLPIMQFQHLRHRLGDFRRFDEAVTVQPETRQHVVAIRIGVVFGVHFAKRQRDGARDLVLIITHPGTVAFDDFAISRGDVTLQHLRTVTGFDDCGGDGRGGRRHGIHENREGGNRVENMHEKRASAPPDALMPKESRPWFHQDNASALQRHHHYRLCRIHSQPTTGCAAKGINRNANPFQKSIYVPSKPKKGAPEVRL